MQKRYFLLLACLLAGCSSSTEDFSFSVLADPSRGHAPANVTFSLERDDAMSVSDCKASWDFGDGVTMNGDIEAEHKFKTSGNYDVSVSLECGDETGTATTRVEIYDEIDLSLASLSARPHDVSTDGTLEVSVQVMNLADAPLKVPTNLDFYLATSADVSNFTPAAATRILRQVISSFPAASDKESTQKLEFSIPISSSIRTGAYYLFAVINPDGETGESNLENNTVVYSTALTVRNQATDGADLKAVRLQMTPSVTGILSSASASFDILNQGSTTAETIAYQIWIGAKNNAEDMTDAVLVSESSVEGSVSGSLQTYQDILVSVTPPVSDPGLYYFWFVIDPENKIIERDEENNVVRSSTPIQVTNEPVLNADIIVESVSFTPSVASLGSTFSVGTDIYNQGSQPTGSFICTVFLSSDMSLDLDTDTIVGSINIDDLQPGTSLSATTGVQVDESTAPGNYYVYVFCDSSGVITEANEDNNIQRSGSMISITSASSIDLLFGQDSSFSPESPEDNGEVNVNARLCNNGSTGVGPSVISVTRTNLCDNSIKEVARQTVDSVEVSSCTNVEIPFVQTCDFWCPRYSLTLTADATRIIAETNELNNTFLFGQALVTSGENCACSSDVYEPNNTVSQASSVKSVDKDLTLCPDDLDWYKIDIKDGGSFRAHVSHDHNRSPLIVELWQNDALLRSYSGSDDLFMEAERISGVDASPLYLLIKSEAENAGNHYHLLLDTYQTSSGTGADIAASELTVDGGRLSVAEWHDVTVKIDNLTTLTHSNIRLGYYLSQTGLIDETATRLAVQTIPTLPGNATQRIKTSLKLPTDTPSATYHLIVKADDEDSLSDVRPENNIARSTGWVLDKSCWDTYDPNESMETAAKLIFTGASYSASGLHLCKTNEDYYKFDVSDGSALKITASAASSGDFDMVLYDSFGNEIASARTSNTTETITRDIVVGDQTLYLRLFLLDNAYNSSEILYNLSIETSPAAEWLKCGAAGEPNDFFSSATNLREIARSGEILDLCPSTDQDYYNIYLTAGERFQLGFETESTRLRATLYGGEDHRFIAMLTNLVTQSFDYTATEDGTYWVRVFTNASEYNNQTYRLKLTEQSGLNYGLSDLVISNEYPAAGQSITVSFNASNLAEAESAWSYTIKLVSDAQNVTLYSSSEQKALLAGAKQAFKQKVTLPASISGNARLLVTLNVPDDVDQSNNTLTKIITISESCAADSYEPNDNALSAVEITESPVTATICEGDEDWYKLTVLADQTISISFNNDAGDLDLFAYDAKGSEIAKSETANDVESLTFASAQTVYLRVKGADSNVRNSYKLTF